jgi:hypothetical protein
MIVIRNLATETQVSHSMRVPVWHMYAAIAQAGSHMTMQGLT